VTLLGHSARIHARPAGGTSADPSNTGHDLGANRDCHWDPQREHDEQHEDGERQIRHDAIAFFARGNWEFVRSAVAL
jgi:hypothetical protein